MIILLLFCYFAESPNSQSFQLLSRLKYNYASNKQDNRTKQTPIFKKHPQQLIPSTINLFLSTISSISTYSFQSKKNSTTLSCLLPSIEESTFCIEIRKENGRQINTNRESANQPKGIEILEIPDYSNIFPPLTEIIANRRVLEKEPVYKMQPFSHKTPQDS